MFSFNVKPTPYVILVTMTVASIFVISLISHSKMHHPFGWYVSTDKSGIEVSNSELEAHNNDDSQRKGAEDNKVILLWNSRYKMRDFGVGAFGREAFTLHHCKVDTCLLETNRSLLKTASAVVFHMRSNMQPFPQRTSRRQLFVYFLGESPHHTYDNSRRYKNRFNVTMTYRHDSDIAVPVSRLEPVVTAKPANYQLKYQLSEKSRNVVWLVSHCRTPSRREQYADALAKYIDVDVYGACGPYKCARGQPCLERFERKYKFYLSFENSFCTDYVTEKYYNILRYELIPIVYGRANYSSLGPSDSFINILDYRSPKELAAYLHFLAANETAYLSYFRSRQLWKQKQVIGDAFCRLCELVHNTSYQRMYDDVHKWWTKGACNLTQVKEVIKST